MSVLLILGIDIGGNGSVYVDIIYDDGVIVTDGGDTVYE